MIAKDCTNIYLFSQFDALLSRGNDKLCIVNRAQCAFSQRIKHENQNS